ncbi:MAG: hypothetical protein KAT70_01200, partial [Thermoplasmata archaeon]|nr:hypothetical protein [Thermoplasmata archaeon]
MAIALSFVALLPMASMAEDVPEWEVGDEWAMGWSMDLGEFQPVIDAMKPLAAGEGVVYDA